MQVIIKLTESGKNNLRNWMAKNITKAASADVRRKIPVIFKACVMQGRKWVGIEISNRSSNWEPYEIVPSDYMVVLEIEKDMPVANIQILNVNCLSTEEDNLDYL